MWLLLGEALKKVKDLRLYRHHTNAFQAAYTFETYTKQFHIVTWQVLVLMIVLATSILSMLAKLTKEKNIKEFTPIKAFIYTFGAYCGIAARR